MIPVIDFVQYDPAWWDARNGIPTASPANKLITTTGNPTDGKTREDYCYRLAVERVTGKYAGSEYMSWAMQEGHKREPMARLAFEMIKGREVQTVGIVYEDEQKKWACSPDGLMEDAGLEIFCPDAPNATRCFREPKRALSIAGKYQQIMMSLMVTGFDHWFFEVYYIGLKPLIQVVPRNEEFIGKLRDELDSFCLSLAMITRELREM